ncbi:DUF58 domain-containing protein [Paenibacillus sp. GCM10027627]|uniref:DUF58 domain-containing protein n=1 Tax=unclassified Paenibacillus TaxID=185978 RepID=UPI003635AEFF
MNGGFPQSRATADGQGTATPEGGNPISRLFPDLSILAAVERMRLAGGKRIRGTLAGKRRSQTLGGSQEFADYRPYALGDDIRKIDWNVYGRTGRAYVRQYWDEQELHAQLYVDASKSMFFSGGASSSKFEYAVKLASLIGYASLHGDDRVAVSTFQSERVRSVTPALYGRASSLKLFRHMADLLDEETANQSETSHPPYEHGAVSDLSIPFRQPGALPRRSGAAWLFTDAMFEQGIEEALLALRAAGQSVVFVQLLSPEEISPQLTGELKLIDSELGTGKEVAVSDRLLKQYRESVQQYKDKLHNICAEQGAVYAFVDTGKPLSDALQALCLLPGALNR